MFLGESIETFRNDILLLIEHSRGYFNINTIEGLENDDFHYFLTFYMTRFQEEQNSLEIDEISNNL